ncbi:MAG: cob(I)yrinic acid a,c-diamide adenosyltransferase [Chloroflexota bacterium]
MSDNGNLSKGLMQVYTGDGKGKTTAALGLAMRAVGQGLKVIFIQFMKGDPNCGEHRFVEKYHPFELVQLHQSDVFSTPKEQLQREAAETFAFAEKALTGGQYDVVILDEVLVAVRDGLLDGVQVMELIRKRPEKVELVLTGRNAPPEVVKAADLVTEMLAIKHPFAQGLSARRGIEF